MNLQTHIKPELWQSISKAYEAGNYTHAIVDAMHYLTDILREKSGLQLDGEKLVNRTLGGDPPMLKINKNQTTTEKNEQKGVADLARGLYSAVRNPRSHHQSGQFGDDLVTADAVIGFINYLVGVISGAKGQFIIEEFFARVFDPYFVQSDRYVQLLIEEIPENRYLETLIELYRNKLNGDDRNIPYVVEAILSKLSSDQVADFMNIVSEELKITRNNAEIQANLHILPPRLWSRVEEVARLRIENKVLNSISTGSIVRRGAQNAEGAVGTWAVDFLVHFNSNYQAAQLLTDKLCDSGEYGQRYVITYFCTILGSLITETSLKWRCITALSDIIRNGTVDDELASLLLERLARGSFPKEWEAAIAENLRDITDPENPQIHLSDGTPLLKRGFLVKSIPF